MKKLLLSAQFFLFIAFNFFLLTSGYQYLTSSDNMIRSGNSDLEYDHKEEFDPALARISNMKSLAAYCDSLYNSQANATETYPEIANAVIQKRFYHGYSYYGFDNNYIAKLLSTITVSGLSAIVIPNDILKYPYAACSQQSIVLMELLKDKGFAVRKVGFSGKITGHFTFEAFYDNDWHYFDPDKEPDANVLKAYNMPSIAFLNANRDILVKAYPHYSKDYVMDVFTTYTYGTVNTFPAPKAILFQKVSLFLSYTMWSFFLLAFIWIRRKYNKLCLATTVDKKAVQFPVMKPVMTQSAYPEYQNSLGLRV